MVPIRTEVEPPIPAAAILAARVATEPANLTGPVPLALLFTHSLLHLQLKVHILIPLMPNPACLMCVRDDDTNALADMAQREAAETPIFSNQQKSAAKGETRAVAQSKSYRVQHIMHTCICIL